VGCTHPTRRHPPDRESAGDQSNIPEPFSTEWLDPEMRREPAKFLDESPIGFEKKLRSVQDAPSRYTP
jgi:hypothetical protein